MTGKQNALKVLAVFVALGFMGVGAFGMEEREAADLRDLLPDLQGWSQVEDPETYFPENLFEYINGAAEAYLSYNFKQLLVAQLGKDGGPANLSVEIYDMGTGINAFGIYSAERYPESRFIPVGVQGYIEEGALNLLVNRYYIKLLCFDCDDQSEDYLKRLTSAIVEKVGDKGELPPPLHYLPEKGRLPNTEKFILNNFMGYGFLHDGYLAGYEVDGAAFDCFLIVGRDAEDARAMLEEYLAAKDSAEIMPADFGYHLKDKYYQNIFLGQADNYIAGVFKVKDGMEKTGQDYLKAILGAIGS